jgi:hypothetical protein
VCVSEVTTCAHVCVCVHGGVKDCIYVVDHEVLVDVAATLVERLHPVPHWESSSGSKKFFSRDVPGICAYHITDTFIGNKPY